MVLLLLTLGLTLSAPIFGSTHSSTSKQEDTQVTVTVVEWHTSESQTTSTDTKQTEADTSPETLTEDEAKAKIQADIEHCRKVLLEDGDVHSLTPSGLTLLQFMTILYCNNIQIESDIAELLKRKVDVNAVTDLCKKTPFFYLTYYTVIPEFFKKFQAEETPDNTSLIRDRETNLHMMDLFLYCGANPLIADENKVRPIDLIFDKGDVEALDLLVKYGWVECFEKVTLQEELPQETITTDAPTATAPLS